MQENIIKDLVNLCYDYAVDEEETNIKKVNINSNEIYINIINKSVELIPSSASIQYSYVIDPNEVATTKIANTSKVETLFSYATLKTSKKTSDMKYADINDIITYFITISNTGNLPADNILFKDDLPNDVKFIPGSILIDDEAIFDDSINPYDGFSLGVIYPKMLKVVTFKVKVIKIPENNEINNIAQFSYDFLLTPNDTTSKRFGNDTTQNITTTKIYNADLSKIKKEADKNCITFGEILTYKTTIPNTGNTDAVNVIFKECIPKKTKLVSGTLEVRINNIITQNNLGKEEDNFINLSLGTIPAKQNAVVTFKVRVIK